MTLFLRFIGAWVKSDDGCAPKLRLSLDECMDEWTFASRHRLPGGNLNLGSHIRQNMIDGRLLHGDCMLPA
ncbi:hypothetical protein BI364_10435 [Acidihalobacter yilgarnensis]|uniref:Uncharacterized protein n=1 Tax=Acidihalobacter yilgarnensis TaxID=2819280 RepID=A0A1D8IPL0_9GAMM|nr:hypothetical protein BI364_10435 [Acidihalobacter yilgarnensis]